MPKLYYFRAPTLDMNPQSDMAPKLGSIYRDSKTLKSPLNQYDLVPIPHSLKNQSAVTNFNETDSNSHKLNAGVNVSLVQSLAGSADLMYTFAADKKMTYQCELLETLEFEPTTEFVKESITASGNVQDFMYYSLFGRKHVYMVTGLKIATGLSVSQTTETQHNPKMKVVVDATGMGIPGEAGPGLDLVTGNMRTMNHGRAVNKVIFAYRVIRIKLKWDGEPRYKHQDGGAYSVGDGSDEDDVERWDLQPLYEDDRLRDFPDSLRIDVV